MDLGVLHHRGLLLLALTALKVGSIATQLSLLAGALIFSGMASTSASVYLWAQCPGIP